MANLNIKTLGTRLMEARRSENLTSVQLSRMAGISENTYLLYEQGRSMPTLKALFNIAEVTNTSIDWLVGRY